MSAWARPPLLVIPQHFGCLVFHRPSARYFPFDRDATALLAQLTSDGIRESLGRETDPDRWESIAAFHDRFHSLGFFTIDGRLAAHWLDAAPPADHLLGPLAVHLEVAAACNLACAHCFAGALPRRDERPPLDLGELDRLFAELAGLGSMRLGLTGGEPLVRRDLLDVLDAALGHGLHPCLTTNALLLTDELARALGRRELVWLNVSLEGPDAAGNDAVRGPGTFARVLEKLALLRRHARFTLAFTITHDNAATVERCARLARAVGAQAAVFRPLYPVGAARDRADLMPSFAEYTDSLARLGAAVAPSDPDHSDHPNTPNLPNALDIPHSPNNPNIPDHRSNVGAELCAVDAVSHFSPASRRASQARTHGTEGNEGCGAGNLVASVSVSGEVSPCSFLGGAAGTADLRRSSFTDIWHHSEAFVGLRARSRGLVPGRFAGGCRARSLVLGGDLDAPDPWFTAWRERGEGAHPTANLAAHLPADLEVSDDRADA